MDDHPATLIEDYIVLTVPNGFTLDDPGALEGLDALADANILTQYVGRQPRALLTEPTEWLITSDWRDVERFQPAHDCPACRAGNDQAIAYLKEHPDKRLALGNLRYREVW